MGRNDDQIRCSFCNKSQAQVKKLIAGPNDTYICDECVSLCQDIIAEGFEEEKRNTDSNMKLPKPKEISRILSEYVIDQDEAKKALAVAVYNH